MIAGAARWPNAMRVEQHERVDAGVGRQQLGDATAGGMPDRGQTIDPELREQLADVVRLRTDVEPRVRRLVRVAETEQVGREHPVDAARGPGSTPPQVRRQREPVHEQDRRPRPDVVVRELAAGDPGAVHDQPR